MCRAEEQSASVFGHDGKLAALRLAANVEAVNDKQKVPDTPNERLVDVLREALDVASGQEEYLVEMTSPPSAAAKALGEATETAAWDELYAGSKTMFRFSQAWTTDVVEAKALAMFAYMMKAKRVMEIGMFTGYGALTIAEVLPPDGKMVSCEIDPFLKEFSAPFFAMSPSGHKIDVRLGPALETMRAVDVAAEGGFDMIFIDADKGGYAAYYEAALTTPGLLAEGGVIVVDNTLFKGQAYLPRQEASRDRLAWNDGGSAIAAFNDMVASDLRVEQAPRPAFSLPWSSPLSLSLSPSLSLSLFSPLVACAKRSPLRPGAPPDPRRHHHRTARRCSRGLGPTRHSARLAAAHPTGRRSGRPVCGAALCGSCCGSRTRQGGAAHRRRRGRPRRGRKAYPRPHAPRRQGRTCHGRRPGHRPRVCTRPLRGGRSGDGGRPRSRPRGGGSGRARG